MGLGFNTNDDNGVSKYALALYKTNAAPKVVSPTGEAENKEVQDTGYTYTPSTSSQDEAKRLELTEEYDTVRKLYNSNSGEEKYFGFDGSYQKTSEGKVVYQPNDTPNVKLQYANFDQVYADADGFIYVAGRGLMPWSKNGDKHPTEEELQKEADQALKEYLSTAVPVSADSLLSRIQATGKEPTAAEQQEIADLLKVEVSSGNLSKVEIAEIKKHLGEAYIANIPDESPEDVALREDIERISQVRNLQKGSKGINTAWLRAVNGSTLKLPEVSGFSVVYLPEDELEFA